MWLKTCITPWADSERNAILDKVTAENKRANPVVQRFKGLGEMNMQLRETTMVPETRRLVQLTLDAKTEAMDMLLAKKRSSERRTWLERKAIKHQLHKR